MLIASRIAMGLGSPLSLAGAAQLVVELAYPKERSTIVGCFQGTWYAGAILAAGVTLGTFDWNNHLAPAYDVPNPTLYHHAHLHLVRARVASQAHL